MGDQDARRVPPRRGGSKESGPIGVFPLLLWSLLAGLLMLLQGASSWAEGVRRLALPLAVVIAAGHMAKGLAKSASPKMDPCGVPRAFPPSP
jgi:hypothetical protein